MSARDEILERVRRNQPAARPLPPIPTFDAEMSTTIDTFNANLARMGGKFVEPPADGDLDKQIRTLFPDAHNICSATPEVTGDRPIEDVRTPHSLHDHSGLDQVATVVGKEDSPGGRPDLMPRSADPLQPACD